MARLEPKSPTEVRDYELDWSEFLGADTIETSTVTVDGVTLDSTTNTNSAVTVWVSGGTTGTVATITNTIETAAGRTEVEVHSLPIMAGEPVTLTEAKAHLRILDNAEDELIRSYITAARMLVEKTTGLVLVRQTFTERHYPHHGAIRLYHGPLVSLDGITYGNETYEGRVWVPEPIVVPTANSSWPTLDAFDRFSVTYTAGFASGEVPQPLIQAMLLLIGHWFNVREAVNVGNIVAELPFAVDALCDPYRRLAV